MRILACIVTGSIDVVDSTLDVTMSAMDLERRTNYIITDITRFSVGKQAISIVDLIRSLIKAPSGLPNDSSNDVIIVASSLPNNEYDIAFTSGSTSIHERNNFLEVAVNFALKGVK